MAIIVTSSVERSPQDCPSSHTNAPAMVGMARKNENSAAERLDAPISIAPTIVAPERDTPGIMARHWITPMPKYIFSENRVASSWRWGSAARSTARRTKPPRISVTQTTRGSNRTPRMKSRPSTPITAAGRKAISTPNTNRRAFGSFGSAVAIDHKRVKYADRIASTAPSWMRIAKVLSASLSSPNTLWSSNRWPVEETGMNSVAPSSKPRNRAWSKSVRVMPGRLAF